MSTNKSIESVSLNSFVPFVDKSSFDSSPRSPRPLRCDRFSPAHSGFTFLEVLFAVTIIGVGVIMLAGIFPVALQQSQANLAESAAIPMSRDAVRDLQVAATNYVPQVTGTANLLTFPPTYDATHSPPQAITAYPIMPIPNELIQIGGINYAQSNLLPLITAIPNSNLANAAVLASPGGGVLSSDRRFAWVGFYKRDDILIGGVATPAPYAQVWIITAQATTEAQPTFSTPPAISSNNVLAATLAITPTAGSVIQLPSGSTPAGPNAYALVLAAPGDSALIGQIVRIGAFYATNTSTNVNIWNLAPGADLNASDTLLSAGASIGGATPAAMLTGGQGVTVFILGSSIDPTSGLYAGPAQDLTATTAFIRVNN
jgi:prepilin-type N-terminal cleavage/methylation domain-containing protein